MTATIQKISKFPSKFGGDVHYIFFKGEDGKSYRTMTASSYRNFRLWRALCENPDNAVGVICEGLHVKSEGLIDADYLKKTRIAQKIGEGL